MKMTSKHKKKSTLSDGLILINKRAALLYTTLGCLALGFLEVGIEPNFYLSLRCLTNGFEPLGLVI